MSMGASGQVNRSAVEDTRRMVVLLGGAASGGFVGADDVPVWPSRRVISSSRSSMVVRPASTQATACRRGSGLRSTIATLSGAAGGVRGWSAPAGKRPRCTGEYHPRGRRLRVRVGQRRLRERVDRPRQLQILLRLGDHLHGRTRALDWVGGSVVAGLGLVVARVVWASGAWGVGYTLFWLWIIVVCIRLIRRRDRWGGAER
jgi:hypothetical protein